MAKERTSVRMQAQIKLMSEQGYSIRAIARACCAWVTGESQVLYLDKLGTYDPST